MAPGLPGWQRLPTSIMIVARDYKAGVASGSMVASCKGGQGVLGGFARVGRSCQRAALVARIVTAHKLSARAWHVHHCTWRHVLRLGARRCIGGGSVFGRGRWVWVYWRELLKRLHRRAGPEDIEVAPKQSHATLLVCGWVGGCGVGGVAGGRGGGVGDGVWRTGRRAGGWRWWWRRRWGRVELGRVRQCWAGWGWMGTGQRARSVVAVAVAVAHDVGVCGGKILGGRADDA